MCLRKLFKNFLLFSFFIIPLFSDAKEKREGYKVKYTVIPFDSLWKIANKFGVEVSDIQKWNNLKGNMIREGQTLIIYSRLPYRPMRKKIYIVRKGDSLNKISKKIKVSIKDLFHYNNLKSNKINVGQELTYWSEAPANESESVGRAIDGKLVYGEMLPDGPGYVIQRPSSSYGTNESINYILKCITSFRKKFPKEKDIVIGDISDKNGGKLREHRSHQSGRDVDIGYIANGGKNHKSLINLKPSEINIAKSWFLIQCFLDIKDVQYIFMDYPLQKVFYEYLLKKKKKSKKNLEKYFQYPRGKDANAGIIKHSKGHYSHFHVRFRCPDDDNECR